MKTIEDNMECFWLLRDFLERHNYLQITGGELDDPDFIYTDGVTRGCLIPMDESIPWVFKFDLGNEENIYYCDIEYWMYQKAQDRGISRFFAAVEPIGWMTTMDGTSIYMYAYERCVCDWGVMTDMIDKWSWDGTTPYDDYKKTEYALNFHSYLGVRLFLGHMWDSPQVCKVYGLLNDAHKEIYDEQGIEFGLDMHPNNLGIRPNGDIVMIDYAGYIGGSSEEEE